MKTVLMRKTKIEALNQRMSFKVTVAELCLGMRIGRLAPLELESRSILRSLWSLTTLSLHVAGGVSSHK